MRNPTAAFAWELWRKNHRRLILIFGVLLGFIIVYPQLCAVAGFNPTNSNSIDEFTKTFHPMSHDEAPILRIGQALLFLFLLAGPITAMFLSLLLVVWMFTVLEFDPTSKNSPSIPGRFFTLPISTSFLFLWLLLGGMATIFVVYEGWIRFVRMPYIEVFGEFQKCIGWMTFLAMGQAIVWGLAGWPVTRTVMSFALLFSFIFYPSWHDMFDSMHFLPAFFVLGIVMARVGLGKMRQGQWQGWVGKRSMATASTHRQLRRRGRFASPSQAQLWFEWRRFARTLCFFVAGVSIVPVAVHLLARFAFGRPLQNDTLMGFTIILFAAPIILHALAATSPGKVDHPFLMTRPLTGGEMTFAILKNAAISTVLSWAIVFVALGGMPLLGDFSWVERHIPVLPEYRTATVIGLIFLTWRFYVANLCFGRSGNRWLVDLPVLIFVALVTGAVLIAGLKSNEVTMDTLSKLALFVPGLLGLIAAKLLLAFFGFRASLKRRLLTPPAILSYLTVWVLIVAALLTLMWRVPLAHEWVLPVSLGVVLLVPLARISFCSIAIEHSRQT